jgi:hypothetical protein
MMSDEQTVPIELAMKDVFESASRCGFLWAG